MGSNIFKVNILPSEVMKLLKSFEADLLHKEFHILGEYQFGIMIFEKYFKRTSSRSTLTIIIENTLGDTYIKSICSVSSSTIFGIDWGINDAFANLIKSCIDKYII